MVVNSTNTDLTHNEGAVEIAIRTAAGKGMLHACKELYPDGISTNGLAVTDSFNMRTAKKIFHVALSRVKPTVRLSCPFLIGIKKKVSPSIW